MTGTGTPEEGVRAHISRGKHLEEGVDVSVLVIDRRRQYVACIDLWVRCWTIDGHDAGRTQDDRLLPAAHHYGETSQQSEGGTR